MVLWICCALGVGHFIAAVWTFGLIWFKVLSASFQIQDLALSASGGRPLSPLFASLFSNQDSREIICAGIVVGNLLMREDAGISVED